jgi:aspartate kinase
VLALAQNTMIVMKFGGTSVESAQAIQRVVGIVASRADRQPVVVVSAMGHTTDHLLDIAAAASQGRRDEALEKLAELQQSHLREAAQVASESDRAEVAAFLEERYRELGELIRGLAVLGECTKRTIDAVSSFGERISSFVLTLALRANGLKAAHVDSRQVIVTDDRFGEAAPLLDLTKARLNAAIPPLLREGNIVVMGGFIASSQSGVTTTLGRGGSDFTASLVGAALGVEEVQIWTDVDGVLTADPTMLPDAHRLRVLSFGEAAELAYFGAKVLHPSTMLPAVKSNIPVRVLNSRRPEGEGTLIVSETPSSDAVVKSIAYKEDITVVNIQSTRMLMAHGFLARIFDVFERHATSVDMVTTSEVSVSLTVDRTERLPAIIAELEEFAQVSRTPKQAIVCVVGEKIRYTPGVAAKVFEALNDINVRMVSVGASRLNISLVIDESDLRPAVEALHQAFFAQVDATVFA